MNDQAKEEKLQRFAELLREFSSSLEIERAPEWPEHELTMAQFKALTYLQSGPQRMGDIGRHLGVSLSSVTNLITRLENKGLVVRRHDVSDRRVVTCDLTDEGRETISALWQTGRERFMRLAESLSPDELDYVLNAFELLARAAQFDASEPTKDQTDS